MKTTLTINDIARLANVSKTTVSFVLNNKEGISDETRKKVLSVIEEHNYKPSLNSLRLNYHKSFTIAVVFEQSESLFSNFFYANIMNALLKRCIHYNYSLVYTEFIQEDDSISLPENVLTKDVDGVIFLHDIPTSIIDTLNTIDMPFIVVDDHSEQDGIPSVKADYRLAARTAVDYLIEQGHKKIGFIGNTALPAFYSQVFSGYEKSIKNANLSINPAWCSQQCVDRESIEAFIEQLFELEEQPTALFCMEDLLAIEVIRCLQKNKKHVPEDYSVIAIDDIILSGLIYPGLTTVSLDKEQIGLNAVDILMEMINNNNPKSMVISSNEIVIRESVQSLN